MSHNTWLHRIVRVGVKPLIDTPVTPNQITTLRIAAGMVSATLFALGPEWHIEAALLFLLSMLLDRADGELARMSGKTSPWGHTYDLISDGLCDALVFIGIGIGARHGVLGCWAIPMGLLAGLSVASIFLLVLRIEQKQGPRAAELPGTGDVDPDDGILAVPVAALLGWTTPLLIAAAVVAPLFALFVFWKLRPAS